MALAGNSVESITESLVLQGQDRSRALQRAFGLAHVDAKVFHPLLNLTMFDGYPTEAILGNIACPTLILHDFDAPGSGLRPPTLAKAMAILSAAHVTHIAGAGHSIHSSNPGAFLNEISLFSSALN